MRQFAVIGLGNFGTTVARALAARGLPVVAVDLNPSRIDEIRDSVTHALVGDATNPTLIGSSGISDVDAALVALGDDIEASVLVTLNLSESGVEQIMVKGISPEHGEILKAVGAHQVIFPEKEMAERIAASLATPNIIDNIPLTEGYNIVELVAPESFNGKTLLELNLRREYGVELLAIKRNDPNATPKVVIVPSAIEIINSDDKLVVMGAVEDVEQIREL